MLLRHSVRAFSRASRVLRQSEDQLVSSEAPRVVKDFASEWKKVVPNLDPPKRLADFMEHSKIELPKTDAIPEKLLLNFYMPHEVKYEDRKVDMVVLPSAAGYLGVEPGKVPTATQLRPGVVSIHDGDSVEELFVSSGFAFVHADSSADVVVVEAVNLKDLDPEAVKRGLAEYTRKAESGTEQEQAIAEIGIEVHTAMSEALGI
eukprot:jgi/Chlat1/7920/Chrsp68S07360